MAQVLAEGLYFLQRVAVFAADGQRLYGIKLIYCCIKLTPTPEERFRVAGVVLHLQHPQQCQSAIKESSELQTDPGAVQQRQSLRKCLFKP